MPPSVPNFAAALVLTYSPRDGAEDEGYADWVRRVDNPFFNAVPGIVRYTNWRVIASGGDVPYGYFDILGLEDLASFEHVWLNEDVRTFTAGWRDKWGAAPGTDSDLNSHVYLCERTSGKGSDWTNHVLFAPGATAEQAGNGFEDWRVVRPIKGDVRFHTLALKYVADQDAFARWGEDSPALSPTALGHCFAAPDERHVLNASIAPPLPR